MNVKEIEGIGPAAVTKLKKAGIVSVHDLATNTTESLALAVGITKDLADKWIQAANNLLRENGLVIKEFVTGKEYLRDRENLVRIKTGSNEIDNWLGGGIETGAITEFYGKFGSGKSQFCHALSIATYKQLGANTIFLDTESTFRPERIKGMCIANEYDPDEVLDHINLAIIENSGRLQHVITELPRLVEHFNAKMIIVDSVIALHRSEFSGRGTLAERQQKINQILHRLLRVAEIYKVAVIITNQVTTSPDTFFGDPTKPTGGNIIGHAATYRIALAKYGKKRQATMVDSPYHEESDCRFIITAKGIEDFVEEK